MSFRECQDIIVLDFMINGERRDVGGRYERPAKSDSGTRHWVIINTVRLTVDEDKIVDAQAYWDSKRKANSEGK
jgi:hypothetical protein